MTGCEACSALVAASDVSCATCGAHLGQPAARSKPARSATGTVDIPVRRYGRVPPPPRSLRSAREEHAGRRRLALFAALLWVGFAGAFSALVQLLVTAQSTKKSGMNCRVPGVTEYRSRSLTPWPASTSSSM